MPVVEKVLPSGAKSACADVRHYGEMWLKQIRLPKGVPLIRRNTPLLLVDVAPGGRALARCICYSYPTERITERKKNDIDSVIAN